MKMDGKIIEDIKFNCDVSDAQYWGYFSICGLLLRYRDLYRSEKGLKAWTDISRTDIAAWIQAKEARWPELENLGFRDLSLNGKTYQAFDVAGINHALESENLVYGAGYGMYMKPTFFLAERKSTKEMGGLTVHTSGRELVRDLFTAPAMLQGDSIFLRLEPLLILLHFKFSELNVHQNPALEAAFADSGFGQRQLMDDTFEKRLEALAAGYADIILAHEVAEHKESVPEWKEILTAAGDRKNEHYLRAVKDLIADTSDSGPLALLIERKNRWSLGLSIALREGFQKILFPEIKDAHAAFLKNGDWNVIEQARKIAYLRLVGERERIVTLFTKSNGQEEFSKQLRASLPV